MKKIPAGIERLFSKHPFDESVRFLRSRIPSPPDIALVLGSGLGDYAESLPHRLIFPSGAIHRIPGRRSPATGDRSCSQNWPEGT